jgi:branched-chain amino acid transport system substrate-binding protein
MLARDLRCAAKEAANDKKVAAQRRQGGRVRLTSRRICAAALAGLVLAAGWIGGTDRASAADEVLVGCMFPMTGPGGLYGRDSAAAIALAVDEVNARGGAAGMPIRVLIEDDKSRPAFAVRIAERFIRDQKVDFLCGVVSSAVGLAVSEVALAHRTIFIGTDHASSRLTLENLHPYYFRVSNNTYQSMAAGALYLAELQEKEGWRRIAFIGPDYEYGHALWDDLRASLDELGIGREVVGEFWPKLYEPDFTPYIAAIVEAAPEILVAGHWGGDAVAFIRQAQSYGLFEKVRFFNFDAGGNYEVMATLGAEMPLGLVLSARHHVNWPDTELNRSFVTRFRGATGRYPSYAAEGAYAGIMAIAAAVDRVGNAGDTQGLIAALEGLTLKLPEDPDGFASYIDAVTHQIVQTQAIGEVVPNDSHPPATTMLGNWKIYPADRLMPSPDVLRRRLRTASIETQ